MWSRRALLSTLLLLAACGDVDSRPGPRGPAQPVPVWADVSEEQRTEADRVGVPAAFENSLGMKFVLIPSGTFRMGSPPEEEGRGVDEVQHDVTLTQAYYLQVTEVSNAQFRRFRPQHDSGVVRRATSGRPEISLNGDEQPAVKVDWESAVAFAAWLSSQPGERRYRLPTEAEWERACRAGGDTAFAFGSSISTEQVVHLSLTTAPVESHAPSRWGLRHMHGNAFEWCADRYGEYPPGPRTDPSGAVTGDDRLVRGGMWANAPALVRCAHRDHGPADRRDPGFRLAASVSAR
ncbi:MAG: formylglycine-generating enzyme family protein [Planctomycetota bacterium]